MFETFGRWAEQAASSMSRREFLGGVGKAALGLAAVAAGLVALPHEAAGGNGCPQGYRKSSCGHGFSVCCPSGTRCTANSTFWYCSAHYPPGRV